jgi:hypothetical protein
MSGTRFGEEPLRVVFLLRENQKWSTESVYWAMERDPRFDPVVAVSIPKSAHQGWAASTRVTLADNESFLASRGIRVTRIHSDGAFQPIESLSPHVVFYDQPYGLPRLHSPQHVSRFALICYVPYGYGFYLLKGSKQRVANPLMRLAWKVFVANREVVEWVDDERLMRSWNVVFSGDPKADQLREAIVKQRSATGRQLMRKRVIFAPHHSLSKRHHNRLATFRWSGTAVAELANRHRDVDWVFKPHPLLRHSLVRSGVMNEREVQAYFDYWRRLANGTVHDAGGYEQIFTESDGMITDSGSFLVEFGMTGRPIILLRNPSDLDRAGRFTRIGSELVNSLYHAEDANALAEGFERIFLHGNDPRGDERLSTRILRSLMQEEPAGVAISDHIALDLLGAA